MIYPFLFLLLTALVSLIFLGYKKPEILSSPSFPFTRKCLGITIFTYGASVIGLQCLPFEAEGWMIFSVIAQIPAWIFLIFVFRGVFELLSKR